MDIVLIGHLDMWQLSVFTRYNHNVQLFSIKSWDMKKHESHGHSEEEKGGTWRTRVKSKPISRAPIVYKADRNLKAIINMFEDLKKNTWKMSKQMQNPRRKMKVILKNQMWISKLKNKIIEIKINWIDLAIDWK